MPNQEQMESLSRFVANVDAHIEIVKLDSDLVHKKTHLMTLKLIEELSLHVKQLQLEVVKLDKQLSDLCPRSRS